MIWTAWRNGRYGAIGVTYGFKVSLQDRAHNFKRELKTVEITLVSPSKEDMIIVNIDKDSFWNGTCTELINKKIGEWLVFNHLENWVPRKPPKFEVETIADNRFKVFSNQ